MSNENEIKLKHLSEREKAIEREIATEVRMGGSPNKILALRHSLKDVLEDAKEVLKRDETEQIMKKYEEDNEELKEVQL